MSMSTIEGRFLKTSSYECPSDLPLDRLDLPQVRPVFSSPNAVVSALERLSSIRMRATLCRLVLPCGRREMLRITAAIDDPSLIADVGPDGKILILAVGPRLPGKAGDQAMATAIAEKLLHILATCERGRPPLTMRVNMVHCWTDSLDLGTRWIDELTYEPLQPLNELLAAA